MTSIPPPHQSTRKPLRQTQVRAGGMKRFIPPGGMRGGRGVPGGVRYGPGTCLTLREQASVGKDEPPGAQPLSLVCAPAVRGGPTCSLIALLPILLVVAQIVRNRKSFSKNYLAEIEIDRENLPGKTAFMPACARGRPAAAAHCLPARWPARRGRAAPTLARCGRWLRWPRVPRAHPARQSRPGSPSPRAGG